MNVRQTPQGLICYHKAVVKFTRGLKFADLAAPA